MKVMVTGAAGMLGQAVMQALKARGMDSVGLTHGDLDVTDEAAVSRATANHRPDAIIHCAAYTAVDQAEGDLRRCTAVNSLGTLYVARAAERIGAKMLYISTDYVFDGQGDMPHEITDRPCPRNVYGLSKWQGEEAVRCIVSRYFILRTSWLFGKGGRNFVSTMRRLGQERSEVRVVDDQIGAPTYTEDLAPLIVQMIQTEKYGVYHASNEGECSFAAFASAILQATGSRCHVEPITTAAYGAPAKRPLNSRLSKRSLDDAGFTRLPIWEDALIHYLDESN